jgi:hypothetical protein
MPPVWDVSGSAAPEARPAGDLSYGHWDSNINGDASFTILSHNNRRSQWPRCLRRRSAAVRLLRLWVRIPWGAWMFVCCECCVLSGRGLCDELITRTEESYRLWCVVVCDLKASRMRRPCSTGGLLRQKQTNQQDHILTGMSVLQSYHIITVMSVLHYYQRIIIIKMSDSIK